MDECKVCANADNEYCFACDNGNQFKPMTNADRIRQMTDEELADIMGPYECVGCPVETETGECLQEGENCDKALLRWLKSPVEVDK